MKDSTAESIGNFVGYLIGTAIFHLVSGYAVMGLWNWLGGELLSAREISYLHGVGLSISLQLLGRIFSLDNFSSSKK